MENEQNVDASKKQLCLVMMTQDEQEHSRMRSDILNRRLKNRERQRRYRARKRLEADMKRTYVTSQSSIPEEVVELERNHTNYISRVHSKRNWKKDARRAHELKNREETAIADSIPFPALNLECRQLDEGNIYLENSLSVLSYETNRPKLGRRDWKAEARKKKN